MHRQTPQKSRYEEALGLGDQLHENWAKTHRLLRDLRQELEEDCQNWVIFHDVNPSFHIYTSICVSAADELIVPITPDPYSTVASHSMLQNLYGEPPHAAPTGNEDAKRWLHLLSFKALSADAGLTVPKIRLVVANRLDMRQRKDPRTKRTVLEACETVSCMR